MSHRRVNIWREVDRSRSSFIDRVFVVSRKWLNRQIAPVLEKEIPTEEQIESLIIEEPIIEMLTEIYIMVGRRFAKAAFKGVQKSEFRDDIFQDTVKRWVAVQGAEMVKGMTRTTKNRIKSIVSKSVEQGEGIPEIALQISTRTKAMTFIRAQVVARTEVIRASNLGAMAGAEQSGIELNKEWIATADGRARDWHLAADGQVRAMNQRFSVGGEELDQPGDPSASESNTINCRCTVAFIPV